MSYFLTSAMALEIEGGFAQPRTRTPLVFTTARWASASVLLNVRAGRNTPYLLGGYTRIEYGGAADAPYNFGDHAIHGAIGDGGPISRNLNHRCSRGTTRSLSRWPGSAASM